MIWAIKKGLRAPVLVLVTNKLFRMKILKIIGHPLTVMCVYLMLLISGQSFGGFYAIYILLGLPVAAPDAIVSLLGLAILLLGYNFQGKKIQSLKPLFYLLGDSALVVGLFLFFGVTKGYNNATFHQSLPLATFILFGLSLAANFALSLHLLRGKQTGRNNVSLNIVS